MVITSLWCGWLVDAGVMWWVASIFEVRTWMCVVRARWLVVVVFHGCCCLPHAVVVLGMLLC